VTFGNWRIALTSGDSDIQLTIIGFWGAYPGCGEATSGYLLQVKGFNLLDCGSAVLSQLPRFVEVGNLDAVLLSHYHADHVADVGCLQYAIKVQTDLGLRSGPLPIYGPEGDTCPSLAYHEYTEARYINPSSQSRIGPFSITVQETNHPALCYAVRIESGGRSIVYTADTGWYDGLVDIATGADLLLCETSLYNRYFGWVDGHLTAGEAGKLARKAKVRRMILTHLPHSGEHEDLLKEAQEDFSDSAELASTGKKVFL
jgi:ribonuclease BN (tRNA processing enzyme)